MERQSSQCRSPGGWLPRDEIESCPRGSPSVSLRRSTNVISSRRLDYTRFIVLHFIASSASREPLLYGPGLKFLSMWIKWRYTREIKCQKTLVTFCTVPTFQMNGTRMVILSIGTLFPFKGARKTAALCFLQTTPNVNRCAEVCMWGQHAPCRTKIHASVEREFSTRKEHTLSFVVLHGPEQLWQVTNVFTATETRNKLLHLHAKTHFFENVCSTEADLFLWWHVQVPFSRA